MTRFCPGEIKKKKKKKKGGERANRLVGDWLLVAVSVAGTDDVT